MIVTEPSCAAQRRRARRALVELGEPGTEVGGIARFAGQLAQASRDFAQRLGPAAGRVGHQRDVQALVAEILGDRDRRVDARLARGHRHVRRVGDDHRALGQRPAGARVLELRELVEHLGHLVAALAAADVDDHVGVAPLGERFLQHGLAGAEAAGQRGAAAARHREQRVEDALAGDHRRVGRQAVRDRARRAHRPGVAHRDLLLRAVGAHENGDRLVLRVLALRARSTRSARRDPAAPGSTVGARRPRSRASARPRPACPPRPPA